MTGWRGISLCGHLRHTCSATEFIWSEVVGILLGAGDAGRCVVFGRIGDAKSS